MTGPIGLTGATGQVGGRVSALLADAGVPHVAVVRDPARMPAREGVEVRAAPGYHAADGMESALRGVGTLLFVPAGEVEDRVALHRAALGAAVRAGVRRIVYLSFAAAGRPTVFSIGSDHTETERMIRASGLAHTILRDNLYLDYLPFMVGPDGVLRGPAPTGRVAAVDRDDAAACAAAVLVGAGHDGAVYAITGREAPTLPEATVRMAAATGLPVRFHPETEAEAYASRRPAGVSEWTIRVWVTSYLAIEAGELATVSGDVHRLLGRAPRTLEQHLAAHPDALAHVVPAGDPGRPGGDGPG